MYNIYADGVLIHHSQSPDPLVKVLEPKLKRSDNAAGSLTMTVPPTNPGYDVIKRLSSEIVVTRKARRTVNGVSEEYEKELWSGRVIDETKDFWNNRKLTCEGELGYLNDTSQPPAEYHNISVRDFLKTLLDIHNDKTSGSPLSIKFDDRTRTEGSNFDYIEIFYDDGNGKYSVIRLNGAIGGVTINIPRSKFYLYWHTDGSVNSFYGYRIESITEYKGSNFTAITRTDSSLPNYTPESRDLTNLPESPHNPYDNNTNQVYFINATSMSGHAFQVGTVTVTDPNDELYRYTNFESTLDCVIDKLVKRLGGHLRIRKENGVRYLDYLAEYPNVNTQTIEFGKNLVDFTRNWDMKDLATVVVPLGCNVSELGQESSIQALEEYLTVKDVNNGSIYVKSDSAINEYGWIETIVHWDDVKTQENLLRKAQSYLSEVQFEEMVLELSAVDMHYFDIEVESINMLDEIRCISSPHGMDRLFPITEIEIPLDRPDDTVFTMGDKEKSTRGISASIRSTNQNIKDAIEQMPSTTSVLNKAFSEANSLINQYTNGYIRITTEEDDYGTHSETLRIMTEEDYTKAKKYWMWNVNGLAHYDFTNTSDPNKAMNLALTENGEIVANRILVGQLGKKEWGNYWNMETGEFHLGLNAYVGDNTNTSNRVATAGNVSTAQANAVSEASTNTTNAINNYDNNLTQQKVFNKLTNHGTVQGISLASDGQLYINASYINSGYISANRISGGTITGITISGNTITGSTITGSTISGGTIRSGSYPFYPYIQLTNGKLQSLATVTDNYKYYTSYTVKTELKDGGIYSYVDASSETGNISFFLVPRYKVNKSGKTRSNGCIFGVRGELNVMQTSVLDSIDMYSNDFDSRDVYADINCGILTCAAIETAGSGNWNNYMKTARLMIDDGIDYSANHRGFDFDHNGVYTYDQDKYGRGITGEFAARSSSKKLRFVNGILVEAPGY